MSVDDPNAPGSCPDDEMSRAEDITEAGPAGYIITLGEGPDEDDATPPAGYHRLESDAEIDDV